MRNVHSLLLIGATLAFLAPDKGAGSGGGPKSKAADAADPSISMPPGAETVSEPLSTVAPATVEQPVANPSETAKLTYRKTLDGTPLEINERPARLAGNVDHVGGFGRETAEDRATAQAERQKAAEKADK